MSRNNKTLNYQPENLFVVTGQEEEQTPYDWDGMPEFDQPEAEAWKVLKVRFRNEEDLRNFAEAIDQTNITLKTKGIWYPPADKTANSLLRYMDEAQISDDNVKEIVEE
jgi:hypothetical protein